MDILCLRCAGRSEGWVLVGLPFQAEGQARHCQLGEPAVGQGAQGRRLAQGAGAVLRPARLRDVSDGHDRHLEAGDGHLYPRLVRNCLLRGRPRARRVCGRACSRVSEGIAH